MRLVPRMDTPLESSAPDTDQRACQNPQELVLEASTPIYLPSKPRSHWWPFCGTQGLTFPCPWAFAHSVCSLGCSSCGWFLHFILVSAQMSPLQKALLCCWNFESIPLTRYLHATRLVSLPLLYFSKFTLITDTLVYFPALPTVSCPRLVFPILQHVTLLCNRGLINAPRMNE